MLCDVAGDRRSDPSSEDLSYADNNSDRGRNQTCRCGLRCDRSGQQGDDSKAEKRREKEFRKKQHWIRPGEFQHEEAGRRHAETQHSHMPAAKPIRQTRWLQQRLSFGFPL